MTAALRLVGYTHISPAPIRTRTYVTVTKRPCDCPAPDHAAVYVEWGDGTVQGPGTTRQVPESTVEAPDLEPGGLPSAISYAPGCLYTFDRGHRCVTETGQPSVTTCVATWWHHNLAEGGAA